MDFAFENLVAVNFVNLTQSQACEVLEARNAVRKFMLTRRKISEAEHFRFIDSLCDDKRNAYFAVYERNYSVFPPPLRRGIKGVGKNYLSLRDSAIAKSWQSAFLGVVCLNQIDLANKNAFFGIYSNFSANSSANNGANLLKILRFIAFDSLGLHILYAKVLSTNARALRFYAKNSFVRCGKLIEAIKENDNFIDLEIWALKNALDSRHCEGESKDSQTIHTK